MRTIQITESIPKVTANLSFVVTLNDDNSISCEKYPNFSGYYTFSADGSKFIMTILDPSSPSASDPFGKSAIVYSGAIDGNTYTAKYTSTSLPNKFSFIDVPWSAVELDQ
jgi:hypothetical protein